MKIRSVGVKLFRVDAWTNRRTDMTNLTVTFHNFENVPKNRTCDILAFIYRSIKSCDLYGHNYGIPTK